MLSINRVIMAWQYDVAISPGRTPRQRELETVTKGRNQPVLRLL